AILETVGRCSAELVGPAVEGVQRGQRRLETDHAVALQPLEAKLPGQPRLLPGRLHQQVAEAEVTRVVGMLVLVGGIQRPAELAGAELALAGPAQAEGAAGGSGEVAVVQPVAIADQGAGGTGPGGVEEMRVELA